MMMNLHGNDDELASSTVMPWIHMPARRSAWGCCCDKLGCRKYWMTTYPAWPTGIAGSNGGKPPWSGARGSHAPWASCGGGTNRSGAGRDCGLLTVDLLQVLLWKYGHRATCKQRGGTRAPEPLPPVSRPCRPSSRGQTHGCPVADGDQWTAVSSLGLASNGGGGGRNRNGTGGASLDRFPRGAHVNESSGMAGWVRLGIFLSVAKDNIESVRSLRGGKRVIISELA